MACSSGYSSGITPNIPSSGSEGDFLLLMDQRKRKRMESNRESARRSRMRKQKHLEEMTASLAQLRSANMDLQARIAVTSQHLVRVEAENAVLRAQMAELGQRLESLNEILSCINLMGSNANGGGIEDYSNPFDLMAVSPLMDVMMLGRSMNHPIMAAASDVLFEY